MLDRLLGINTLEDTEPVILEEVDAELPAESDLPTDLLLHLNHSDTDFEKDVLTNLDMDGYGEEEMEAFEDGVDDGNA